MTPSYKAIKKRLLESGNKLFDPPPSVDELLSLLDRVESCLSKVEQSPSKSMKTAIAPSLKALVDDKLLGHSDFDVKVAVASCISEITRITAPEPPYDDDRMKVLLTVGSFRSQRDYHPENVTSYMETIMTLSLEESEDISVELLFPILASLKNDNGGVLPVARRLGERVLESCAAKVKPYLVQAVKELGSAVNDYSKVVTIICGDAYDDAEKTKIQASDENMANESRRGGYAIWFDPATGGRSRQVIPRSKRVIPGLLKKVELLERERELLPGLLKKLELLERERDLLPGLIKKVELLEWERDLQQSQVRKLKLFLLLAIMTIMWLLMG